MRCSVYIVYLAVLSCSNLKLHQMLEMKNIFKQEKMMLQLMLNPGLTLTGFLTTWPRCPLPKQKIKERQNKWAFKGLQSRRKPEYDASEQTDGRKSRKHAPLPHPTNNKMVFKQQRQQRQAQRRLKTFLYSTYCLARIGKIHSLGLSLREINNGTVCILTSKFEKEI